MESEWETNFGEAGSENDYDHVRQQVRHQTR